MTKNKNNALKGGYKYKQIMRRYGKRKSEPALKVIRKREIQSISNPVYTFSSTVLSPVEIEYSYTPSPPPAVKIVPKAGKIRGEG
jgi:hypothetical protein